MVIALDGFSRLVSIFMRNAFIYISASPSLSPTVEQVGECTSESFVTLWKCIALGIDKIVVRFATEGKIGSALGVVRYVEARCNIWRYSHVRNL